MERMGEKKKNKQKEMFKLFLKLTITFIFHIFNTFFSFFQHTVKLLKVISKTLVLEFSRAFCKLM